ncbi:MAG: hypothetical protein WCQ99_02380, partial [Pseudomonadota bacterium]
MTTYKHKTGSWAYDFVFKKQRYCAYGFESMNSATRAEGKKREEVRLPHKPPEDITLEDLCNLYLDYCEGFNSPRGYQNKKYVILNQFKKWSKTPADQLTRAEIEKHMLNRKEEKSADAANNDRKVLHALYRFAVDRNYVQANPCAGIKKIPVSRTHRPYIPPQADVAQVLLAAPQYRKDMIALQQHLVARGGEIALLQWEDIDLSKRQITLWTNKSSGGHARSRTVYLNNSAHKILTRLAKVKRSAVPW